MKAHYFRQDDGEFFLVPEEDIEGFDKLKERIENSYDDPDAEQAAVEEFNNKYWKYKVEGELYSKKLFIEE